MGGLPAFYLGMKKADIKPIIGCEIYMTEDRFHRGAHEDDDRKYWHLGLIAMTTEGYYNMCEITSRGYMEGFYRKARVDWEILRSHSEGLIALTGCMASPVMSAIFDGNLTRARERTERLVEIFGTENVYGEIQNVGIIRTIPADSEIARMLDLPVVETFDSNSGEPVRVCELSQHQSNQVLIDHVCKPLGLKYIATGDCHYLRPEDANPHDALVCVSQPKKTLLDEKRFSLLPNTYYMRSAEEMMELLPDWPEALAQTRHLADRCNAEIPFDRPMLPVYTDKPDEFFHSLRWQPPHKPGNEQADLDLAPFALTDETGKPLYDSYIANGIDKGLQIPEHVKWDLMWKGVHYTDRAGNLREGITHERAEAAAREVYFDLLLQQASSRKYLRHLCEQGMAWRYGDDWREMPEHVERLEFEFNTVDWMGFIDYFLWTWDIYEEARKRRIAAGPGRGSGAGSEMLYVLNVTQLCPIEYDLLFERFLNPDRISMPDVDMDFSIHRRGELIEYIRDKCNRSAAILLAKRLGKSVEEVSCTTAVAQIITYGVIRAKAAIKDAARVLGYEAKLANRITKMIISKNPKVSLDEAIEESPDLRGAIARDAEVREIIELARWLEGFNRNESIHAAGVVIYDGPLERIIPLQQKGAGAELTTAYEMSYVEMVGALKMDFLGLRNLDVIEDAVEKIRHTEGIELEPYDIPVTDPKTYELLSHGDTAGVFQVESSGMQSSLRMVKPTQIEDINALVALYRPGPMRNIPTYAARKHGQEDVVWEDERLKESLGETYGIAVYQEQLMQMTKTLANFTPGEADNMRKAVGKKLLDKMQAMEQQFVDGCKANGLSESLARKIWERDFLPAADYSFNKCLAAETPVLLASGERVSLRELHELAQAGDVPELMAMWPDGRMRPHAISRVVSTGRKGVLRVTLSDGTSALMSEEHRVLTNEGYLRADQLVAGHTRVLTSADSVRDTRPAVIVPPVAAEVSAPVRIKLSGLRYQRAGVQQLKDWLTESAQFFVENPVTARGIHADFLFDDVYWKVDGMDMSDDYYRERYRDLPYRVVAPEEVRLVMHGWAKGRALATGQTVVAVEPAGERETFDVEMAVGGPRNFIAGDGNGLVSHNSHAACYGRLTYITAYLKRNHPHAYMAALLSSVMGTKDKGPLYLQETRRMGLPVLPPDINKSLNSFTVIEREPGKPLPDPEHAVEGADRFEILVGLRAIKSVGDNVIAEIKRERESERGEFTSFHDFVRRMPQANKTALFQLVRSGAFDKLGMTRRAMFDAVEEILDERKKFNTLKEREFVKAAVVLFEERHGEDERWQGKRGLDTPIKRVVEGIAKIYHKEHDLPEQDVAYEKAIKALDSAVAAEIKKVIKKQELVGQAAAKVTEEGMEQGRAEREKRAGELARLTIALLPDVPRPADNDMQDDMLQALEEAISLMEIGEWPIREKLQHEYDVLGIYISGHPLDEYYEQWSRYISLPLAEISGKYLGQTALICGVITGRAEQRYGRNKEKLLYKFQIDDFSGSREIAFFNEIGPDVLKQLVPGELVAVKARVKEDTFSRDDEENTEASDEVAVKLDGVNITVWDPESVQSGPLLVQVPRQLRAQKRRMAQLETILDNHAEDDGIEVMLQLLDEGGGVEREMPWGHVKLSPQLMHSLRRTLTWKTQGGKRMNGRKYVK
jgi:DNA polymerase III alpha subunit